jgi:uncharacterized protein
MGSFDHHYGPWALVTGASSGLGAAFARQLADRGLHVVLVGRRQALLEERAREVEARGRRATVLRLDLLEAGAVERVVDVLGDLDVGLVVHSAGVLSVGPFDTTPLENDLALLDLNVRAPMELTRRLLPRLRRRERAGIVFLSSFVAYRGAPNLAAYAASKAWTLNFAESLGPELAPFGVDVLAVCPGFVDTPMIERFLPRLHHMPTMSLLSPDAVVTGALKALGRRYSVISGARHVWLHRLMRLLPRDWVSRRVGIGTRRVFLPAPSPPPRPPSMPDPPAPKQSPAPLNLVDRPASRATDLRPRSDRSTTMPPPGSTPSGASGKSL